MRYIGHRDPRPQHLLAAAEPIGETAGNAHHVTTRLRQRRRCPVLRGLAAHAADLRADRNSARGVTGVLLYQSGSFMQVLEGEPAIVEQIFAKIQRDPRHRDVLVLLRGNIETRNFGDWSMGFVDVRASAIVLPGFRAGGDFHDLVGDTRSIERVIRGFRDGGWHQTQTA
jgi:hypothetical protein